MDPREFHSLASKLAGNGSPVEVRTAISRAYYAVYHVGAEILREMGFRINRSASGHADVRFRLSNSGDTEVIKIGAQLGDLQNKRNEADYDLSKPGAENRKTAQAIVAQAGRMIRILDNCCQGSKRAQIVQAIHSWERLTGNLSHPGR